MLAYVVDSVKIVICNRVNIYLQIIQVRLNAYCMNFSIRIPLHSRTFSSDSTIRRQFKFATCLQKPNHGFLLDLLRIQTIRT